MLKRRFTRCGRSGTSGKPCGTNDTFVFTRGQDDIAAEAALDGLYVIATTIGPEQMDAAKVVATYKSLALVERDFRFIKAIDLDLTCNGVPD
jgi:transposase